MRAAIFNQPALLVAMVIAMGFGASESPVWMGLFALLICGWRWLSEKRDLIYLPRTVTAGLAVLLAVQIYFQYRSIFGQEPSNALLLGMCALKIMDYRDPRDHKFLVLMGFVMIAMKAVFSIDFYWILPSFVGLFALWWSLLPRDQQHSLAAYHLLARIFMLSLPLALVLFFVFPRVVVPWASRPASLSSVGFSGQLDPGSVAELASLDQLAFRVRFNDRVMVTDSLYWRGSVLTIAEGLSWNAKPQTPQFRLPGSHRGLGYEVILEPGSQGYLFTLDRVTSISSQNFPVVAYSHSVFRAFRPLTQTQSYRVTSDESLKDESEPDSSLLQIPKLSPRVQDLVDQLKAGNDTDRKKLLALRRFFRDGKFSYTLNPGSYANDQLDAFLFERKRGFCEHFAAAFAILARAMGIPARVVVGYQGGLYNPVGDFWSVNQRDAHAWVEVFENPAWVRVDPTLLVAPLRLELGSTTFFGMPEGQRVRAQSDPYWFNQAADAMSFWVEDLNYRWTYFMLDFDQNAQAGLWLKLAPHLGLIATVLVLMGALLFLGWRWQGHPTRNLSLAQKRIWELRRHAQSKGVSYQENQSPLPFLNELQLVFPNRKLELERLARIYDLQFYANRSISSDDQNFLKQFESRL